LHRPNIPVTGSEDQIKQILWNLLLNSAQAVDPEKGMLLIATDEDRGPQTAASVRLMVADNGSGIPENIREKIFEPFFSTKADGTGLGLPIVARIVDCLGGRIELDSTPDWKTRFCICLPSAPVETRVQDPVSATAGV
jgi:signal transduction histidine kinase